MKNYDRECTCDCSLGGRGVRGGRARLGLRCVQAGLACRCACVFYLTTTERTPPILPPVPRHKPARTAHVHRIPTRCGRTCATEPWSFIPGIKKCNIPQKNHIKYLHWSRDCCDGRVWKRGHCRVMEIRDCFRWKTSLPVENFQTATPKTYQFLTQLSAVQQRIDSVI